MILSKQQSFWILLALGILGLNLFVVGPWVSSQLGEGAGNILYVILRVAVIIGLSFFLVHRVGKGRFQAMTLTAVLMLMDQVGFKALWLKQQMMAQPDLWKDVDFSSAVFGLLMSYVFFVPMVLLFAWIGAEFQKLFGRR